MTMLEEKIHVNNDSGRYDIIITIFVDSVKNNKNSYIMHLKVKFTHCAYNRFIQRGTDRKERRNAI